MLTPEVWPEYGNEQMQSAPSMQSDMSGHLPPPGLPPGLPVGLPPGLPVNMAQMPMYTPVVMPGYPMMMPPQAPPQLQEPQEAVAQPQAIAAEPKPGVSRECPTLGTQVIRFTESAAKLKTRERNLVSPRFHLDLNDALSAPFIMKLKALNKGFKSSAGKGTVELSCQHNFGTDIGGFLTYRFWIGFGSKKQEAKMNFRQHDFAQNRTSREEEFNFSEAIDDKGNFFTVVLEAKVETNRSQEPQRIDLHCTNTLGNPAKASSQGDEGQLESAVSFALDDDDDELDDQAEAQAGSPADEQLKKLLLQAPATSEEDDTLRSTTCGSTACSRTCTDESEASKTIESNELDESRQLKRSISNPEDGSVHRTVESATSVRPTPTPLGRLSTDPTHNRESTLSMDSPMKIGISEFLMNRDQGINFQKGSTPVNGRHEAAPEPDPEAAPAVDKGTSSSAQCVLQPAVAPAPAASAGDPSGLAAPQVADKQSSLSAEVARLQQLKHLEQQTWNVLPGNVLPGIPGYGVVPVPPYYSPPQNYLDSFSYGAQQKWTNVCVKSLPNNMKRQRFLKFLQDRGCLGIDFIYVPHDFKRKCGKGFGFVNFTTVQSAQNAFHQLGDFNDWKSEGFSSKKMISVCWAKQHMQGLDNLIEFFRNSTVMHDTIDEEFKPLLLENGVPKNFPGPLKRLRKPQAQNESE